MPKNVTKRKKEKPKSPQKTSRKSVPKEDEKITALGQELKELGDRHLRLKAEFDNFRRRKTEEFSKFLLYDGEQAIKGFLPIIDDLERMMQAAETANENGDESLADGVKMVSSKIEKYFESLDVKPFGAVGDVLDPDIHDAMMTKADETRDDNVILEVFEKGFTYREKVIRHAKVIVNKK